MFNDFSACSNKIHFYGRIFHELSKERMMMMMIIERIEGSVRMARLVLFRHGDKSTFVNGGRVIIS